MKINFKFLEFKIEMEECSICYGSFKTKFTTECKHTFCKECLLRWYETNEEGKCPICRREFSENDKREVCKISSFKRASKFIQENQTGIMFLVLSGGYLGLAMKIKSHKPISSIWCATTSFIFGHRSYCRLMRNYNFLKYDNLIEVFLLLGIGINWIE